MRRWPLLIAFLFCLAGMARAAENSIQLIPTGPGNSMQPVPLADGSVVFVTDREENLDLAIRFADRRVEMWEAHPADDYAPRISEEGITFLSNRGKSAGELWQRALGREKATYMGGQRPQNPGRFKVEHPFDSNADGRNDILDLGWIVDSTSGLPVTPLSLDARDGTLDSRGRLWFSLMHQGRRWIARLDAPQQAIAVDLTLASWDEWQLLATAREKDESYARGDALRDAGYWHAADDLAVQCKPEKGRGWEPCLWQRRRAALPGHPERIGKQALQAAGDAEQAGYAAYTGRIYTDAAQLLRDAGLGVDALAMLNRVKSGPRLHQALLLKAELLIAAHSERAAISVLSAMEEDLNPGEKSRLIKLADLALAQMSGKADRLAELYGLLQSGGSSLLKNHWRIELARLHLKTRGFEAALSLLEQEHASAEMQALRMRVLATYAADLLQRGMPEQAMRMAQEVLSLQADDVAAGRTYFDAAKKAGRFAEASAWWRDEIGTWEENFSAMYLEAYRMTYEGQLKQAQALLERVAQEQPYLWQARQTLGWILEKSEDQGQKRRALSLYEEAFGLAVSQSAEAPRSLRVNLVNLAFRLQLYDKQLKFMDQWQTGDHAGIPSILMLQAARACYLLSRPAKGLLWLDRLPDTLLHDEATIALRLRALIAAQAEDYEVSQRAMNLLISDPEIDDPLRVRLLLNKARVGLNSGDNDATIRDLHDAIRLQHDGDHFGLIRLPNQTLAFDASWIASSLLAEAYRNEGEWTDAADYLRVKLKPLQEGPARLIALQNLAVALIRKGSWQQAYQSIARAATSDTDSRLRFLKIRLGLVLGITPNQQEITSLLSDQALTDKEKITLRMIGLMQQERPVSIALGSQFQDVLFLNRQMKRWRKLQSDARLIGAGTEVPLHMGLWMMRNGMEEQGVAELGGVAQEPSLDAWIGWWISSCILRKPSRADLGRLPGLFRRLSIPMPVHVSVIEDIYRRLAKESLRQDNSQQALELLIEGEMQLSRLRRVSVASRPLPGASTLKALRRELRADESMLLVWKADMDIGETDLWWMDHDHVLYRHFSKAGVEDVVTAIRDWQEGKSRLYWVSLHALPKLEKALEQMMPGVSLVASPTLIHAARLGRQASKGNARKGNDPWEAAERSLMDWRWSLQDGLKRYGARAWSRALDQFERAMPYLPERQRTKLLALAGKAALRGGLESRGLGLFKTYRPGGALASLWLRLKAGAAEKGGDPVLAAEVWRQLGEHSKNWKDRFDAAASLTRLALQGVVAGRDAEALLQDARRAMPPGAVEAQQILALDLIRLRARFGFGEEKETEREIRSLRRTLAGKRESLWQLELLAIEIAWKSGHLSTLDQRLRQLQQQIPDTNPLRFDVANLKALILHATGKLGDARQAYAEARKSLIHVPAAAVPERMAALHNNLGRLEMDAGADDAALRYFRAALDIDVRRGDKVGALFDRKNLGQLLLTLGKTKEGMTMLAKAEQSARALRISAVEAETTALLLLVRDQTSLDEALAFRAFVEKHGLAQLDWVADWLPGEVERRSGADARSEASLRHAMATVEKEGNAAFSSGLLQPMRVYESLIALLFEKQPEMARQIAGRALNNLYGNGKKGGNASFPEQKGSGLLYFTGEKFTWVWYASVGEKKSLRLNIGRQALMRRISSLNRAVVLRQPVQQQAKELARLVWSPVSDGLKASVMLDVTAVGPLQSLSFAMLRDDAGWLLRQHAFRYPLKGDAPAQAGLKVQIPWSLYGLAMADSSRPLYLADSEAQAAHDFMPVLSTLRLEADKQTMLDQAGKRANLHIASHVDLVPGYDDFSSIVLTGGERLFEFEIAGRHWQTEWVVLSACGADWSSGRALYGNSMSRAFLRNGVKRVIAGLWQVNDLATALLMKRFYRELGMGSSLPVALWHAQLAMQKRFSHPADWAGFRLEAL